MSDVLFHEKRACFCELRSQFYAHAKISLLLCVLQRGETALHMAARAGQADVVRYLLKNGAKVETKSKVKELSFIINRCVGV